MYETFRFRVLNAFYLIAATLYPSCAWAAEDEKKVEWILPYFILIAFVSLGTLALLRLTNRAETSLSNDEVEAAKREQLKK